ncbi:MAG: hypothetical protein AB1486_17165 [Planctomycetota bacterium]
MMSKVETPIRAQSCAKIPTAELGTLPRLDENHVLEGDPAPVGPLARAPTTTMRATGVGASSVGTAGVGEGAERTDRPGLPPLDAALARAIESGDLKALQAELLEEMPALLARLRRAVRENHLAFEPAHLLGDLLARLVLERQSYAQSHTGDLDGWVDASVRATLSDRHRRVSRLLAREMKAFAVPPASLDRAASEPSGEEGAGVERTAEERASHDASSLADALAALPESHRKFLSQLLVDNVRYSELGEQLSIPESAVPAKIRRIREHLRALADHIAVRDERARELSRQALEALEGQTLCG